MPISFLSEGISISEVAAAIESVRSHNMAKLLTGLEKRNVEVDFGELPLATQGIVHDMIAKKHWCTGALKKIILDIPDYF